MTITEVTTPSTMSTTDGDDIFDGSPSPETYLEYQIMCWLWRCVGPVILLLGTLGNCLAFAVLRARSFRVGSVGFALSALTVVDTGVLWTSLFRQWLMFLPATGHAGSVSGTDIRNLSAFSCRSHLFLGHCLSQLSSWTVAMFSLERALTIGSSFVGKRITTRRRTIYTWTAIAAILVLVNLHYFWIVEFIEVDFTIGDDYPENWNTTKNLLNNSIIADNSFNFITSTRKPGIYVWSNASISQNINGYLFNNADDIHKIILPNTTITPTLVNIIEDKSPSIISEEVGEMYVHTVRYCTVGREYLQFYLNIWYYIDLSIWAIAPFICIIAGNATIIARLSRSRTVGANQIFVGRHPVGGGVIGPRTRSLKSSSTLMLLAASAVFLMTTAPFVIYLFVFQAWLMREKSTHALARIRLAHCLCSLIYFVGNSANFLLYCVSGSRFRTAMTSSIRHLLGLDQRHRGGFNSGRSRRELIVNGRNGDDYELAASRRLHLDYDEST